MTPVAARSIARSASIDPPSGEPCRVLAIDYGRKRIGLALSDGLQLTAQPLLTLTRTNRRNDLHRLRGICRKYGVARILVGRPLHMTGQESKMSEETAQFARRLYKELGVEVELADERLTSWEAAQIAIENRSSRVSHRKTKSPIDDVAAAVLLREYLDRKRSSQDVAVGRK
jgi:putative holliday junction resolvase